MIAYPQQFLARQQQPSMKDTGCVFPFATGGSDVRVWLLTSDQEKADALGTRLHEYGCPLFRRFLALPRIQAIPVVNVFAPKEFNPILGGMAYPFIKFGGSIIALETTEPENVVRFARWLCDKNAQAEKAKPQKAPSLSDLADAGEIESIEA